jgi:hypothetical protein
MDAFDTNRRPKTGHSLETVVEGELERRKAVIGYVKTSQVLRWTFMPGSWMEVKSSFRWARIFHPERRKSVNYEALEKLPESILVPQSACYSWIGLRRSRSGRKRHRFSRCMNGC